jgi:pilus assembly protein CpaB
MRRPIIFVLLAGFAALVAALVVYSALKRREAEVQQAMAQSVELVVASHDLTIGTKLSPKDVRLVRWSRDSMPPGSFTDQASIMGQYTKSGFVENEPIVADRLFTGEKNAGVLPLLIPQGMRAVSVPVDEISDIAGFVLPHTHVDVLISTSSGTPGGKPFSKTVLENVEVLAVAQDIERVNDQPVVVHVVTFLVTPEEAERITLASHEGTLRLAMRNYDDKKIVQTTGVDVQQLLRAYGGPQQSVPLLEPQHVALHEHAAPRAKPVQIEILRNGTSSESVSFIRRNGSMQQAPANAAPPPEPASSAAESPNKVANVSVPGRTVAAAAAPSAGPSHAVGARAGRVAADNGGSGDGLAVSDAGPAPFSGPTSRTVDIP